MIAFRLSRMNNSTLWTRTFQWAAICVAAAFMFLVSSGTRAQSNAQPNEKSGAAPSGNKENGRKLFLNDGCYSCHGREGQGAVAVTGPRIGPPQLSFEAFVAYLQHPAGQMPPYTSKVVSDQDLADLYAYLQSRPKAASGKDIPLLNQ